MYNDGVGDDKTEDTLFEQIGTRMKVEDKLLQFHKKHYATNSASSSVDGTKVGNIGGKSRNGTYFKKIKGPVDSVSRNKCLEKKLPNVARPFKYNDKFPLLKDEILYDAYNYYVNKITTVPTGFVQHVDDITEINEASHAYLY